MKRPFTVLTFTSFPHNITPLIFKNKFITLLFLSLLILGSSYKSNNNPTYNFNKKYTITQLQADLTQLRKTLEEVHPRLYEYTGKKEFDGLFDSLYNAIKSPMTEREFQYYLAPVIGKTHCSHTKLLPSKQLSENIDNYISAPPFKLYFNEDKAFLHKNYSNDTTIKTGAEILSINEIKTEQLIKNFTSRIHNEGKNTTFIYNRLNAAVNGLYPALCDYPDIKQYTLSFKNPGKTIIQEVSLKAISQNEYSKLNPIPPNYAYQLVDSLRTAIITVHSFKFKADSTYYKFIKDVFAEIKLKQVKNLIIDLRGNIGGLPEPAAAILRNITHKEFEYYNKKVSFEFNNTIIPSENSFKGKVFFLIDGGCRSTTGHFVSLARFHNLGTFIGEETCASFSCNSNGTPFTLENTGLILDCPYTTFDVAVTGQPRGNGIMPDVFIKSTVEDLINSRDAVLSYTLEQVKLKRKN